MSDADKVRRPEGSARPSFSIWWLAAAIAGFAAFVFVLIYFILPLWWS